MFSVSIVDDDFIDIEYDGDTTPEEMDFYFSSLCDYYQYQKYLSYKLKEEPVNYMEKVVNNVFELMVSPQMCELFNEKIKILSSVSKLYKIQEYKDLSTYHMIDIQHGNFDEAIRKNTFRIVTPLTEPGDGYDPFHVNGCRTSGFVHSIFTELNNRNIFEF